MPRCLYPDETYEVVLEGDQKLAKNERPFFTFRPLTIRQWRLAMNGVKKLQELESESGQGVEKVDEVLSELCDIIRLGLCGWGNMYDCNVPKGDEPIWIPYDPAAIDALVGIDEANELMAKMLESGSLTVVDKKKFGSQLSSGKASSAKRASRNGAPIPQAT